MSAKLVKKGKNPPVVDSWLDSLGLYRKNVAYDETCLFRAASEQLFGCQLYHERVRKECLSYARDNCTELANFFNNSNEDIYDHLDKLEKHMVICGQLEIKLISKTYDKNVMIFFANTQEIEIVSQTNEKEEPICLCLMDEDHFDSVYQKDHILTAGFCQSIVYRILYENVFKIQNIDDIVNAMLYEKTNIITTSDPSFMEKDQVAEEGKIKECVVKTTEQPNAAPSSMVVAPFPFKIAKALDPKIYRNIEYDTWGEVRREWRLGDWYYGDDKLILGTRCVLNDQNSNELHDCYIQEILKDQNQCVVYLTKLAEKRLVSYTDLSPECDAKPWPLPYRFSKNLVIGNVTQLPSIERIKNIRKKNKEKKRTKSCSEANIATTSSSEFIGNVSAYVGAPLQMQSLKSKSHKNAKGYVAEKQEVAPPPDTLLTPVTPEVAGSSRFWEPQNQWQAAYLPPTPPDPFVWPSTPTTPNYEMRPMVASAPVTPSIITYHDNCYPYYYNCPVEPYSPLPQWLPPPSEYHAFHQSGHTDFKSPASEAPPYDNVAYEPMSPLPPVAMEMYAAPPAGLPFPPGTPVMYATPPEDVLVQPPTTPVTMYPSPSDVQYVQNGGGYVCAPPTPPIGWYTPHVNAQGFVFPTVGNSHNATNVPPR